ncbi:hypothetical protein [Streptomyces sp. NPDC088752]|uniref:hypothetical protein n=1 Tax=Streptomyces sp. NPDC088752 TaxID=3154963 RepID=UPI0034252CBC
MPDWKALPEQLGPEARASTERIRRLTDRGGPGAVAAAGRTGHERAACDAEAMERGGPLAVTVDRVRAAAPRTSARAALVDGTGGCAAGRWDGPRGRVAVSRTTKGWGFRRARVG